MKQLMVASGTDAALVPCGMVTEGGTVASFTSLDRKATSRALVPGVFRAILTVAAMKPESEVTTLLAPVTDASLEAAYTAANMTCT